MKHILFLLPLLLALSACDASDNRIRYDLTLSNQDEEPVMDLSLVTPNRSSCQGLGCGAGNATWTASSLAPGFTLEQTRGTLYAVQTGDRSFQLSLPPEAVAEGIAIEFEQDPGGTVTGEWVRGRVEGDTLTAESSLSGRVVGMVE